MKTPQQIWKDVVSAARTVFHSDTINRYLMSRDVIRAVQIVNGVFVVTVSHPYLAAWLQRRLGEMTETVAQMKSCYQSE